MSRRAFCVPIVSSPNGAISLPVPSTLSGSGIKSLLELCLQYVGTYFQEQNLSLSCIAELNMEIKQQLLAVVCAKNKLTPANLCIFLDTEIRQLNLAEGRGLNDGKCDFVHV